MGNKTVKKLYKKIVVGHGVHVKFANNDLDFHRFFAIDAQHYAAGNTRRLSSKEYAEQTAEELKKQYTYATQFDVFPIVRLVEIEEKK